MGQRQNTGHLRGQLFASQAVWQKDVKFISVYHYGRDQNGAPDGIKKQVLGTDQADRLA